MNRIYYQQDESGGGMVSFEEAFGRDPFTGEATPEPDPPEDTPPADEPEDGEPVEEPEAEPVAQDGAAPAPGSDAWRADMLQRFPNGESDLWKSYRELEARFSQTRPSEVPPTPEPEPPPPPAPLRPGSVGDINTEEDLFAYAQADPKGAADFALQNRERLNDTQFNAVMNNWFAVSPFEASQAMAWAQAEALREQIAEQNAEKDAHYLSSIRDQGIAAAVAELPMIEQYREEMATFVESNPHLQQWVEGLTTADQVKSALHSIFYQMAGPKLSQQILEQQVARSVQAREAEAAAAAATAAAEESTQKAKSQRRSTAAPSGEESYDEQIQQAILSPGKRR